MNIEEFRARVAESAAAAQKAARHLSSLDEMAEKDEYIQSPDLNVSKKRNKAMGHESSSSSFSGVSNINEANGVSRDQGGEVDVKPRESVSQTTLDQTYQLFTTIFTLST